MSQALDGTSLETWVLGTGDTVLNRPSGCDPRLPRLISAAEVSLANLEVPLTTRGTPAEKAATHRAHPDQARQLRELGFSAVTLANNHALDYGWEGLQDTVEALTSAGIAHVGAGADEKSASASLVRTTPSGTVAFLGLCSALPPGFAATTERPGVAPLRVLQQVAVDPALVAEQPGMAPYVHTTAYAPDVDAAMASIQRAREVADLVVVAIHWGVPHGFAPASYGAVADYQRPVARRLVEAGAHLVLGHHPHVVQPFERIGQGIVAYSVGNFMFHNWTQFSDPGGRSGPGPRSVPTAPPADTSTFPLEVPSAPYRSAFHAPETLESVVVMIAPPRDGSLTVRFLPTTMNDGDPRIPGLSRCHSILDRLEARDWRSPETPRLARRTDLVADAVVGEVVLS